MGHSSESDILYAQGGRNWRAVAVNRAIDSAEKNVIKKYSAS
jgi:hypothetical protein